MKKLLFLLIVIALFGCSKNSSVSGDYLNFTAVGGPAIISLDSMGNPYPISLQYSTNGCVTWHKYAIGQDIKLKEGKTVYFKATSTNEKFSKYFRFKVDDEQNMVYGRGDVYIFDIDGYITADGNIMSLLDEKMERTDVPESCFSGLFYDCGTLINAPQLPAITLDSCCYAYMFWNDSSLENAPVLPATKLQHSCYFWMFYGCHSLISAPELPALELSDWCYCLMFSRCRSLKKAPELPATELAFYCYGEMFSGCTSLTQTPELPATALAPDCYTGMFAYCTSLAQTPELPATTLAYYCYHRMFCGCTSLKQLPVLPATLLKSDCYREMFRDCTSLIINTYAPGEEWRLSVDSKYSDESSNEFEYATYNMFYGTSGNICYDTYPYPNFTYYVASAE